MSEAPAWEWESSHSVGAMEKCARAFASKPLAFLFSVFPADTTLYEQRILFSIPRIDSRNNAALDTIIFIEKIKFRRDTHWLVLIKALNVNSERLLFETLIAPDSRSRTVARLKPPALFVVYQTLLTNEIVPDKRTN